MKKRISTKRLVEAKERYEVLIDDVEKRLNEEHYGTSEYSALKEMSYQLEYRLKVIQSEITRRAQKKDSFISYTTVIAVSAAFIGGLWYYAYDGAKTGTEKTPVYVAITPEGYEQISDKIIEYVSKKDGSV